MNYSVFMGVGGEMPCNAERWRENDPQSQGLQETASLYLCASSEALKKEQQ